MKARYQFRKDYTNCHFCSFVVEIQPVQVDAKNQNIGIDLGNNPFAVMSDGSKAERPNYSKHVRKMHKLQKTLVGQQKGSRSQEAKCVQPGVSNGTS